MLKIYKLPIRTPYPVGPVNAYLIKNKPYTLVDPGPETAEAKEELTAGLTALGVSLTDISRIVLTHSHADHSGLAHWLSKIAGAQIYIHQLEMRKLTPDYDFHLERFSFLQEAGLPSAVLREILNDIDPVAAPVLPDTGVTSWSGGETLEFTDGALSVLHLSGHSDGHVCLYDQDGMRLLAGDFVLEHITPNPGMEPNPDNFAERLPTLKNYLSYLDSLEILNPGLILPGHGKNIYDSREIVKITKEHHRTRLAEMASALENKSISVYQLMRYFYPQISGFNIYLGISEVFAHVDYLLAENKIIKKESHGISLFQKNPVV